MKRMWLAVCVAGLAALVSVDRAAEPDPTGLDAASVLPLLEQHHVPGVSIAIIKDFKIAWTATYGTADVVTGAAVDADTVFQAASISKPVAAMAVLKAVSDRRFGLDEAAIMTNGDNGGPRIREIESRVAAAFKWDSLDKRSRAEPIRCSFSHQSMRRCDAKLDQCSPFRHCSLCGDERMQ